MITLYCKHPKKLKQAALGEVENDLLFYDARVLNVFTKSFLRAHVYVYERWIAHVEYDLDKPLLPVKRRIDCAGRVLCPAFIDAHAHIESSLLTPGHYAQMVIPHGTLTVLEDAHEIANVWGEEGLSYMLESARSLPMRQLLTIPSCIPSVVGLENSNATFSAPLYERWLKKEGVVGLGEVMDYTGVIRQEKRICDIVETARVSRAYLQGHAPLLQGEALSAYLCSGVKSDHECKEAQEVLEKYRQGMWIDIRDSNTGRQMPKILAVLKEIGNYDRVCFSSDDRRCSVTVAEGHMDGIVRKAYQNGMPLVEALISASYRAAVEAGIEALGAIAPGYVADLLVMEDLEQVQVRDVYFEGRLAATQGQLATALPPAVCPPSSMMKLPSLKAADFRIRHAGKQAKVNVIQYESHTSTTTHVSVQDLPIKEGCLDLSQHPDHMFAAIINRYGKGTYTLAVVERFGIHRGALATTFAHDAHNVAIVYDTAENAETALRQLYSQKGGFCAVDQGKVIAAMPLPIAGLMSQQQPSQVISEIEAMNRAIRQLGNTYLEHPLSRITILSLLVCPYVKISDVGIVLTNEKKIIHLFDEEET